MKYAATKTDLRRASKEANEAIETLNMARGLVACSQAADARAELGFHKEAIDYVETAERRLYDAASLLTSIRHSLIFED